MLLYPSTIYLVDTIYTEMANHRSTSQSSPASPICIDEPYRVHHGDLERTSQSPISLSSSPRDPFSSNAEPESLHAISRKLPWIISTIQSLQAKVESLEKRLNHTQDIQAIEYLLNHYTALHDDAVSDLDKRREWEGLFAKDGIAVYPFGSHQGRAGKGDWALWECQLLRALPTALI